MLCPIAGYKIDENGTRVVGGFVLLAMVLALVVPKPVALAILLFLVFDFGARAFSRPRLSPLANLAASILKRLVIAPRRVDAGPKRFAARIGLVFAIALVVTAAIGAQPAYVAGSVVLGVCAFLESVFGFCAGCFVYTGWYSFQNRVVSSMLPGSRVGV